MFYIIISIWIEFGRRFPIEYLRFWQYRENRHNESFPHLLFYLNGLGVIDVHIMPLNICGFRETKRKEGHTFVMTVNQIAFKRVPQNGMIYWKQRTFEWKLRHGLGLHHLQSCPIEHSVLWRAQDIDTEGCASGCVFLICLTYGKSFITHLEQTFLQRQVVFSAFIECWVTDERECGQHS